MTTMLPASLDLTSKCCNVRRWLGQNRTMLQCHCTAGAGASWTDCQSTTKLPSTIWWLWTITVATNRTVKSTCMVATSNLWAFFYSASAQAVQLHMSIWPTRSQQHVYGICNSNGEEAVFRPALGLSCTCTKKQVARSGQLAFEMPYII